MSDPLLSVENLRTTFHTDQETIRAVDGASFSVAPTETLGIVGESGSGKSVTARSILGLVEKPGRVHPDSAIRYHDPAFVQRIARAHPDATFWDDAVDDEPDEAFVTVHEGEQSGEKAVVERGSVDLVSAPDSVARQVRGSEIAMVSQDALSSLNPVYTVGNQIEELLGIHRGLSGREATETAEELLRNVGIPDPERRLREYPHQFSGGMQQRAVIAMALSCDPDLLIADEPTTALDVTIEAKILDQIEDLAEEFDTSIQLITHDLGVIAQICDRVMVMYAGRPVEKAPVEELYYDPKHPYTVGLMSSIPRIGDTRERLQTIPETMPDLVDVPTGCSFHPRCPYAEEACTRKEPVLVDPETGHEAGDGVDEHAAACLEYTGDLTGGLDYTVEVEGEDPRAQLGDQHE